MFNLVLLIDLKKAFDTVDHQILIKKLELYEIKGQAIIFFKFYLKNRKQKSQIRNSFSSERLIKCADGKNFTASANSTTNPEAAANSDLENVRKWSIANKLRLNVANTEFILIGSKSMIKNISNSHPNVFIENEQVKQVY